MYRMLSTQLGRVCWDICALLCVFKRTLILGIMVIWGAQTSAQETPREPIKLSFSIEAELGVNPDNSLRPSPIKVRIYELKDTAAFEEADYFSLDTSDKITLAADMLVKEEFILRPGQKRNIDRKSNAQTTAIGVLAGYRDLPNAIWRVTHKLKPAPEASWVRTLLPANRAELLIRLQPQGIAVSEKP